LLEHYSVNDNDNVKQGEEMRKNQYKNWKSATGKARLNTIITNWFDKFCKTMTLKDYATQEGIDVPLWGHFAGRIL
jgi:hypothetical protein